MHHSLSLDPQLVTTFEDLPAPLARRRLGNCQPAPIQVRQDESREPEERLGEREGEGCPQVCGARRGGGREGEGRMGR